MADYIDSTKYLTLLAGKYPTKRSVQAEIINMKAILNLPKGTEHFISDIHGEYEAFIHILNNCSGEIRDKVQRLLKKTLSKAEISDFCTLIYYPKRKIELVRQSGEYNLLWQQSAFFRLIALLREVTAKYTRSEIRKVLPVEFAHIIDEIINANFNDNGSQSEYYQRIVESVIELGIADDFIIVLADLIKRMVVNCLHIIGDIFDRGSRPDLILDLLIEHHNVDIQWGNHDVLWLGAALGSEVCMAAVVANCAAFGNIHLLEHGYGINLRHLAMFAEETYRESPCFSPRFSAGSAADCESNKHLYAKMYKAASIIMFKLEGELYLRRIEYDMSDRVMLGNIDYQNALLAINGKEYPLRDSDFPTVDISKPLALTSEERFIVDSLKQDFTQSLSLQRHAKFLLSNGGMYKIHNQNLLYHGCIPMDENGDFTKINICGEMVSGKALMDQAEKIVHRAFYQRKLCDIDFIWYLWCGKNSPLFGRDKITTFERLFIKDEEAHLEKKNPYYPYVETPEGCQKILNEFGLAGETSHIINGHVPVLVKKGENPVMAEGKYIRIDGGFCKAYHCKTGIAGYTLIFNSREMRISAHTPFSSLENAVMDNMDIDSKSSVIETMPQRIRICDTDTGKELCQRIDDMTLLLKAYESGLIDEGIRK